MAHKASYQKTLEKAMGNVRAAEELLQSIADAAAAAAVSGDWSGSAPTTIKDALDRLAAASGPIA